MFQLLLSNVKEFSAPHSTSKEAGDAHGVGRAHRCSQPTMWCHAQHVELGQKRRKGCSEGWHWDDLPLRGRKTSDS